MENAAALAIQSPYLLRKTHLIPLSCSIPFFRNRRTSRVRVRAETEEKVSAVAGTTEDDSVSGSPDKSSAGSGTGFGSSSSSSRGEKKKKRSRERAAVIRRSPIDKPDLFSESQPSDRQQQQQQDVNESAFLLTWLGLGVLILVEGIALAASGFLPEEWDKFFVKYLYPSFTPTVFLFVGGTVAYGVVKYLQGEQSKS